MALSLAGKPVVATANVAVGAGDQTGDRKTPAAHGIVGLSGWSNASGGIKIAWTISFDGTDWNYSYLFTKKDGTALSPQVSHMLLEVSSIITSENVEDFIYDSSSIVGPMTWPADPNSPNEPSCGANNANPNLPAAIYAIKVDMSGPGYSFKSTQPPMWGDFFIKDGSGDGGPCTTAWNSGFGTDPDGNTADFTPWVPVPDTEAICGDGAVNQPDEQCDGADDEACPGECSEGCLCPEPPVCGDNIVNQEIEECDGTDDDACPGQCSEGCLCPEPPVCGDNIVNQEIEECDGTDDDACPGQCSEGCLCPEPPVCGDNIVNQEIEDCDGTDDDACPGQCDVECICPDPPPPVCGDGVVNTPDEQCDGDDDEACPGECTLGCLCPEDSVCGDGDVTPPEECEPPNSEDCNNMVDDDDDGLIDCKDPDCIDPDDPTMGLITCDLNCMDDMPCTPIRKDPATIRWGDESEPDRLKIHGRFEAMSPIEPVIESFGLLLTNEFGVIYRADLISGDMRGKIGRRRFRYKDKTAKVDGVGLRNGIYAVGLKLRRIGGIDWMTFRIKVYSDLSLATVPKMTTQIVVGNDAAVLSAAWTETRRGWKLHQRDF
jgi:hypothetical protein